MATLLSTIRTKGRRRLLEVTESFFTDDELLDYLIDGARDLWRPLIDLHQDHFLKIDETNVSAIASTTQLSGVPADVFRVSLIQPRDLADSSTARDIVFKPAGYTSSLFRRAIRCQAVDPSNGGTIYYATLKAGSPVAAPEIHIAPQLSSTTPLKVAYIQSLATLTAASANPIPGESDLALEAWMVAHAMGRDAEDREPDASFMAIYLQQKNAILIACTPRSEQEPRVVPGVFDDEYDDENWY